MNVDQDSSFLANISHEMRTPLNVIMGFTRLLQSDSIPEVEKKNYVQIIEKNSEQLLKLVDNILNLSKLHSGKVSIEWIDFDVAEFLQAFINGLKPWAMKKNIDLLLKIERSVPTHINSDPTRLLQILNNVVGNAIKFTDKGAVSLIASYVNNILQLDIEDTGCGISDANQLDLFQPFTQANSSIARRFGGSGLGLVLTRKICEALGGSFQLRSSHPGQGSHFVVQVKALPASIQVTAPDNNMSPMDHTLENQLAQIRVLLVEDCIDNRRLFSIFLRRQGADITTACDGQEALEIIKNNCFDVILMDLQMPRMDGITAVKHLRQLGFETPVLALTAHAVSEEKQNCLQAGFCDFLVKPIDSIDLIKKIRSFVHRA